ncbi:translation initiation factor eIF-2 alpha subunit [Catovirus CTV1]|uniref:Translation initiation factor eIF-2 alpha subunit n=1 Tax=Catovirus CTV1 TaxID=1977631 RepID=A0A1V0SC11_9VIRU|nr:translation initiation factor eIF-2 alpha subunit [Catovirus CTV1]
MRFYKQNFPKVDDIVFVKFNRLTNQYTVIVNLVEYDNMEAMILATEVNNKKVNVEKIFHNKILPCQVLSVDEKRMYVDLSFKKVTKEDSLKHQDNYPYLERIMELGNEINQLYEIYKERNNLNDINIYEQTIWEIFDKAGTESNLVELYDSLVKNPINIFQYSWDIPKDFIGKCVENYLKRTKITNMIVTKDFELTVLEPDAINILKSIIIDNIPSELIDNMTIECVSSPKYRLTVTAKDDEQIKKLFDDYNKIIMSRIKNIMTIFKFDENYTISKEKTYQLQPFKSFIKYF